MLFVETLIYQSDLAEQLGLKNLRILRADPKTIAKHDPNNTLHKDKLTPAVICAKHPC